jgi:hypothetical protein
MKPLLGTFFALLLTTTLVQAEPQYTVIMGQSCFLCHTNPTGRFMRSNYGSQFFTPQYLSATHVSDSTLKRYNPQITPFLSVGADLRTIWHTENSQFTNEHPGLSGKLSTNTGSMAQMEGFIYFNLQASEKISITGMQATDEAGGHFEIYGLANVLPLHGYAKAGQFQENFGWGFTDHTAFVRTGMFGGYDGTVMSLPHPMTYGTGGEIGIRPAMFDITGSFTNDASIIPWPRDMQKRWFARIQGQHDIDPLGLSVTAGASWFDAPHTDSSSLSFGGHRNSGWGGFGGIGWQGLKNVLCCKNGL